MIKELSFTVILIIINLTAKGVVGGKSALGGGSDADFFKDCINDSKDKMGPCFTHPTTTMRNNLNKCKCEVYLQLGGERPQKKNGKTQKCKLRFEDMGSPMKEVGMMIPDFKVKVCFWKKMGMIEGQAVDFNKFKDFINLFDSDPKVKEALLSEIDKCDKQDPLPEVKWIDRVPLLPGVINELMRIEDFKKSHCMGAAFGKICEDVTNYDFDKFIDKLWPEDPTKGKLPPGQAKKVTAVGGVPGG